MAEALEPARLMTNTHALDENIIFSALGELARRKLLAALAREGPQPAIKIHRGTRFQLSNTVRHLSSMRDAGIITMTENPADGRRALYELSNAISSVVSDSGVVFRFGFPSYTADVSILTHPSATKPQWNEDLVFSTLSDPARRGLLLALARGGPQTIVSLAGAIGRNRDVTLKRLVILRASGFVTMSDNPNHGRRNLYSLSPKVPLTTDGSSKVIDFGFCVLRLG